MVIALAALVALAPGARAAIGDLRYGSCLDFVEQCAPEQRDDSAGSTYAIAVAPNGRHLYRANFPQDTVAIMSRDTFSGTLAAGPCIGSEASRCAERVPGSALDGPAGIAVSPDDRQVYVAAQEGDTLTTLDRDPASGRLTFAGCAGAGAGCSAVPPGLHRPRAPVVTSDGRNVYVASAAGSAVLAFSRDTGTGRLTYAGCAGQGVAGCAPVPVMSGPLGLALSPDDRDLYVAAAGSSAVVQLRRDPAGTISFAGCVEHGPSPGSCAGTGDADAIRTPIAIAATTDAVYVGANGSNAVATLARDPDSGALAYRGCASSSTAGCTRIVAGRRGANSFVNPFSVVAARDGRSVHAAYFDSNTVATFHRDAAGDLQYAGCVFEPGEGCESLPLPAGSMSQPSTLAEGPLGDSLYVGSANSSMIVHLRRETVPRCRDADVTLPAAAAATIELPCDAGGPEVVRSIVAGPAHGRLSAFDATTGRVTYTPERDFQGDDSFTFKGATADGESPVATVRVKVTPLRAGRCTNTFRGASADDTLIGTSAGDLLIGLGGRDLLVAAAGDDCLEGGDGNDRLDGGAGNDALRGGAGNDKLVGRAGNDRLYGDSGNDTLYAGTGANKLYGGSGRDVISARNRRRDTIDCGSGRDRATVDRTDRVKHCDKVSRR